jgi:hypothetical protein
MLHATKKPVIKTGLGLTLVFTWRNFGIKRAMKNQLIYAKILF